MRNKTKNFVHNVSKLCDKCYKLLNESVLSGLLYCAQLSHRIDLDCGSMETRKGMEGINYNGRLGNWSAAREARKELSPEVN